MSYVRAFDPETWRDGYDFRHYTMRDLSDALGTLATEAAAIRWNRNYTYEMQQLLDAVQKRDELRIGEMLLRLLETHQWELSNE